MKTPSFLVLCGPIHPLIRLLRTRLPAVVFGLAVCLLSPQCRSQEIQWYPDIPSATQAATEQDKLVFLHFSAEWCKPCRTLETFVFRSPDVQRAFAQNVIAVKVDVDAAPNLVEEYGVASVPFDVAVTPSGRVVSRRKSPLDAITYEKMLNDFQAIIGVVANGESPALNQNLAELEARLQEKQPKFEGKPTSFTPDAPTYQAPQPSFKSAELARRSGFVKNPFVKNSLVQQGREKPREVQQQFTKSTSRAAPQRITNSFVPSNRPNSQLVSSRKTTSEPLSPWKNPVARSNQDFRPQSSTGETSPSAQTALRESIQQPQSNGLSEQSINDGGPPLVGSTNSVQLQPTTNGRSYQARINLPMTDDFLPEAPIELDGKAQLASTTESMGNDSIADSSQSFTPEVAAVSRTPTDVDNGSARKSNPVFALQGKCPVTLLAESKWVDGDPQWGCVHRNRVYIFSSERHLKLFQMNPDANSPILAGYDPVVFEESGRLVDGLEKHGVFMGQQPNQRIVLFANADTRAKFKSEPMKYLDAVRQAMKTTGGSTPSMR